MLSSLVLQTLDGKEMTYPITQFAPDAFSYQAGDQKIQGVFKSKDEIRLVFNDKKNLHKFRWTRRNGSASAPVPDTSTCKKRRFIRATNQDSSYLLLYTPKSLSILYSFNYKGKNHISSYRGQWIDYPRSFRMIDDDFQQKGRFVNPGAFEVGALYYYEPYPDYKADFGGGK